MRNIQNEAVQCLHFNASPELAAVRVFLLKVSGLPGDVMGHFANILSLPEKRKAVRFRFEKDRRVYVAGRGFLRMLASECLEVPVENLEVGAGTFGKPFLQGFEKTFQFNLSNSSDLVALAIHPGGQPIGLDLEKINLKFDYWEVAGYYFSEKECAQIHSHRDFYRFWTMKEALLKVTGAGLTDDLPRLDLSQKISRVRVTDERLVPFQGKAFSLYVVENEEFVVTLALPGTSNNGDRNVIF